MTNFDERRELLLRRLNEISLQKRHLAEQCQQSSSNVTNGSSPVPLSSSPFPYNHRRGSDGGDLVVVDDHPYHHSRNHHGHHHEDDDRMSAESYRGRGTTGVAASQYPSGSPHAPPSSYKPRASSSGLSGVGSGEVGGGITATGRKKPAAPPKRRRGEQPSALAIVEGSGGIGSGNAADVSESDHAHRNGKHHNGKSKQGSVGLKSTRQPPPAIDLDAVAISSPDPSPASVGIGSFIGGGGDRSRGRSSSSLGYGGAASPQGSPTLSSRGSGRVRTPSVLLSSQPGEKLSSGAGGTGGQSPKSREVTYCLRLLKDLIRLKDGYAFSRPINQLWSVEQLPGYFDIVKMPMDLGTVKQKLEKNDYMTSKGKIGGGGGEVEEVEFDLESFKSDVKLVFENARTYNRPGDMFYESASRLLDKFESKMKQMPSFAEMSQQASKKSKKRKKTGGVGSTADGGGALKKESGKKRKLAGSKTVADRGDENGRGRTSKKKPPIPGGGKSRGAGTSKKKRASGGGGASGSGRAGGGGGDPEVVEVPKRSSSPSSDMSVPDLELRLRALKRQRTLMESGSSPASPPVTAGSSTSYMAQAQALYHVEMTFKEKVQLSTNVGKLPADKLQKIVALATKNKSSSMEVNHNEEIELDIDSMNNETLREMEAYVNQILSKGKKKGVNGHQSALTTSPNADILTMSTTQVDDEVDKLTSVLRKKTKGHSKELMDDDSRGGSGGSGGGDDGGEKKRKSFYDDTESSSESDSDGSGSGSSDDSSSDDSDSDDSDESDEETTRKRRERNMAHQQAMQAAGTPLPSPGYQSSQRSS